MGFEGNDNDHPTIATASAAEEMLRPAFQSGIISPTGGKLYLAEYLLLSNNQAYLCSYYIELEWDSSYVPLSLSTDSRVRKSVHTPPVRNDHRRRDIFNDSIAPPSAEHGVCAHDSLLHVLIVRSFQIARKKILTWGRLRYRPSPSTLARQRRATSVLVDYLVQNEETAYTH